MDGMVEDANRDQAHPLEVLAIVQARGGSKTIPRKNLRLLAGHPLVAYSIATGLAAKQITRLIVSTDDAEIASVCESYGAEVPFLRPVEFAEDASPDLPLFQHALDWFGKHEGYYPDLVVQLRPTSPLRPLDLVDQAIATLTASPQADCVRGVTIPNQNPYKMWRLGEEGFLKPLLPSEFKEPYNMPRQHLPTVYWQTGHIDVIRYETIVKGRSLTGKRILPAMIDPIYWVDIDTEADWTYAEWLINSNRLPTHQPLRT
jgi:CMP-N-acetylneuraminic acid synthetase